MACATASAQVPEGKAAAEPFAVVDDVVIGAQEFDQALTAAITQKFYHRRPPDDQLELLRKDVGDRLVDSVLLLKEARRRGIAPDAKKIDQELATFERRNRNRPQWQEIRAQMLPELTRALQDRNLVEQLEASVRLVTPPSEAQLAAYFDAHPESFTEPERLRLSLILLKVDPSEPATTWEATRDRARGLLAQIAAGTSFGEVARQHSGDKSASEGGDMGYWHRGTLPSALEGELDKLAVGAISEPIRILEGIAVLRLDERRPAQLRKLAEVRAGVIELWTRDRAEEQWRELIARLRTNATIRVSVGNPARPVAAADGQPVR